MEGYESGDLRDTVSRVRGYLAGRGVEYDGLSEGVKQALTEEETIIMEAERRREDILSLADSAELHNAVLSRLKSINVEVVPGSPTKSQFRMMYDIELYLASKAAARKAALNTLKGNPSLFAPLAKSLGISRNTLYVNGLINMYASSAAALVKDTILPSRQTKEGFDPDKEARYNAMVRRDVEIEKLTELNGDLKDLVETHEKEIKIVRETSEKRYNENVELKLNLNRANRAIADQQKEIARLRNIIDGRNTA